MLLPHTDGMGQCSRRNSKAHPWGFDTSAHSTKVHEHVNLWNMWNATRNANTRKHNIMSYNNTTKMGVQGVDDAAREVEKGDYICIGRVIWLLDEWSSKYM